MSFIDDRCSYCGYKFSCERGYDDWDVFCEPCLGGYEEASSYWQIFRWIFLRITFYKYRNKRKYNKYLEQEYEQIL